MDEVTGRPRRMRSLAGMLVAGALLAGALSCAPQPNSTNGLRTIDPCATDATIACDPSVGHLVAVPADPPRNQLVVFFNGTAAAPVSYKQLIGQVRDAGYHVIALRYRSLIGTKEACPDANVTIDPDCHRVARSELTFGENVADPNGVAHDSAVLSVPLADSVENRLLHLIAYLDATYPTEGWGQYLNQTDGICNATVDTYTACDLDWSKTVLMGHSLGSGIALFLSKFHPVSRVAMISGPYDEFVNGSSITVAPRITEGGFATSASNMFGLTHVSEPNVKGQSAAWNALGMVGPKVAVASSSSPYGFAQELTTNVIPACTIDSNGVHNSTAQDACTPGSPPDLSGAWRYLAGP